MVEISASLYHCNAADSLPKCNQDDTDCDGPWWVDVGLVAGEKIRCDKCLDKGHGMSYTVLVTVAEKKGCNFGNWGVVCGCCIKLEEVEESKRAKEQARSP